MGSQNSTMQAKKRNYFSVEYLNENNHDLDFTKTENFTRNNYSSSLLKHQDQSSRKFEFNEPDKLTRSDLNFDYEALDSRKITDQMRMSSRSSQNLVGLVRNGGVLVKRSKSYVKSENKVLPSNFITKPLKETNLLMTVGLNRTWRNNNKTSIRNPVVFDKIKQKQKSVNDLHQAKEENSFILTRSKPDLYSKFNESNFNTSFVNENLLTDLMKEKSDIFSRELDEDLENIQQQTEDLKKLRSKNSKLSSWSMLVKKQKNLDSITSRLNNKENLSHNAKQSNTKIGKSRSFLHQIKTYKMRTFNASDKFAPNINTSNQKNRILEGSLNENKIDQSKTKNKIDQSKTNDKIQIISRFPINSKVYRHYIAGNGNKSDKLTNSIDISNIMRNRKSFSKRNGSYRRTKQAAINKKVKSIEQESLKSVTDHYETIFQERAIDVDQTYDIIYEPKNDLNTNYCQANHEIEQFYFDNESIDNEHILSSNKCKNISMKPLDDDSNISRPSSIILTEDVKRTNDLIKSCKKILEENNALNYECLTEFFQNNILNKSSLHSSDNRSEDSSDPKDIDSIIPEFYLRSSKCDFEVFPTLKNNEPELTNNAPRPQIKQRKSLRTVNSETTSKDSNFILKPKGNSPNLRSKSIPDSINNPQLDSIDLTKNSSQTKSRKELNICKNKRKGLTEIFPNINLDREIKTRLSIKDPNWCPATDLYGFDLDCSIDAIESQNIKTDCINNKLANIFENSVPIKGKIMIHDGSSESSESHENMCFNRRERDFLKHQPFTHLNLLY